MPTDEPQAQDETRTRALLIAELPEDPQASIKPAGGNAQLGHVTLSRLSEISFCMDDVVDSIDGVGTTTPPPSIPGKHLVACSPAGEFAFILGRMIGQGGMGEVREARQRSLDRTVAVKRPKPRVQSSEKTAADLELFAREAAITARLEHPHIIPVHDLGLGPDGMPLLAMKLVRGTPWCDLLKADHQLTVRERLAQHLPILVDVAQAVAFAHARGIIHRDLKPSQVMVGRHGEVYLMDWGIACSFDTGPRPDASDQHSTAFAAMDVSMAPNPAGTTAYMAPEQTEKSGARLGPWTDVWLLGAMLYEILTRRPPYPFPRSSDSFIAAARGVVEPPSLRIAQRNTGEPSDVPPEIEQLCMDCLQPEIGKRLPSAEAFIERLRDYQSGASRREESRVLTAQATEAFRQIGPGDDYDMLENCDRTLSRAIALDPENAEAIAAKQKTVGLLADEAIERGDLHLARVQAGRVHDQTVRANLLKRISANELHASRIRSQRLTALAMCVVLIAAVAALALLSRSHMAAALRRELKLESAAVAAEREARQAQHEAELRRAESVAAQEALHASREAAVYDLYVSNLRLAQRDIDIEHYAHAEETLVSAPPQFRQWEWGYLMAAAHPELMTYSGHKASVQSVAFSPDEKLLASASHDGTVRLWNVSSGEEVGQLHGHAGQVRRVYWSLDGKFIATASADRTAAVWDGSTYQRVLALQQHPGAVEDVRFFGDQLATLASDAHLRFFDRHTGNLLRDIDLKADRAFAFDLSPDGHYAAAGVGASGGVLVSLDSGTTIAALAPTGQECSGIRFSPDGSKVALSIASQRSYICAVPTGETLIVFTDSELVPEEKQRAYGWATDVRWTPDGRDVIAGMRARPGSRAFRFSDADLAAKKFKSIQPASLPTGSDVCSIDITSSGRFLAVGQESGIICLYDQQNDRQTTSPQFDGNDGLIHGLRWSPDGTQLVASGFSQRRFNLDPFKRSLRFEGRLPDNSHCTAIEPNGTRVAFSARHFGFIVEELDSAKELLRIPLQAAADDATWINFSPDGNELATVCSSYPQPHNPSVDLWSSRDGSHIRKLSHDGEMPFVAAFAPSGKALAMGTIDGRLIMVDPGTAQTTWEVRALDGRINALSFSRDGVSVAAAGAGGEAGIFRTSDGRQVKHLTEHGSEINDICFNPNGSRIATASYDATVGIWDPLSGRALCSLKGHSSRVWQAQWSPDGKRIASSSSGLPGVRLWEPMDVSQTTSTATWAGELRAWQESRFAQRKSTPEQQGK